MSGKKSSKFGRLWAGFAGFLVLIGMITGVGFTALNVYAVDGDESDNTSLTENTETNVESNTDEADRESNVSEESTSTSNEDEKTDDGSTSTSVAAKSDDNKSTSGDSCKDSLGALGWIVCPATGKIAEAVDSLYHLIEDFLVIDPIPTEDGTPVYEIWKYFRGFTNIVFIIFLLVVIYSQITGYGISNYGVKKALPKLIVMAIMVNLSFMICLLAVDVSNIIGASLRGIFENIETSALATSTVGSEGLSVSYGSMFSAFAGGSALAIAGTAIAFEMGSIWMLIPVLLGAIVAVASGLITIALRQAVVILLVMISPLAMVANILPNTEQWFKKWKNLFTRMLVFYPMFSLLFGASSLAGFAIILSAKSGWGVMLGMAVQIFPLFFSWSLMKMSGTVLGDINTRLRGLSARPLATSRAWADSHRQATRLNFLAFGRTPSSHLRRAVNNRRALREKQIENLTTIRRNRANMYVQRKISGGYDGTKAQGNSAYLRPNKYTHAAKAASTSGLQSETATMDTAHVLGNYGNYFVSKDVRDRLSALEKSKDEKSRALAEQIRMNDAESQRNAAAGKAFLEYSRAQMTAENDNEADFNFMVGQFLGASTEYDPNAADSEKSRRAMEKYRHYIVSSAGGLGETGQTRVLGKIIARAAAVESNQRRDINIVAQKFPPDKRNFRNFLFNYYVDDDGFATDKEGNRIEDVRDYLRVNDPEKLVMWDKADENGPYYDWYDVNGQYVTRIYKRDKSAIKELMSNFDTPINDPINNLFVIHAGIKEQPNNDIPVLQHMGLDGFRTTVGRALLSAPFKDKNAAFSPMVAEMVKKGYIKNYAQEYLAYLDSLNKATKPGAFNVQDADAIKMFAMIMNPDKWPEVFPEKLIRGYLNVNGEPISGYELDENGEVVRDENTHKPIKVPNSEATYEQLMACVKEKFIIPAAHKMTMMMSRQTPNTADNQKAGTVEEWKKLKEVFDTKWGAGKKIEVDPYEQKGDMREIVRDVRESLHVAGEGGAEDGGVRVNHAAQVFEIFNRSLDGDDFAVNVSQYLAGFRETAWISDQVQDYIVGEGYGVTKEQIYDFVIEQMAYLDVD